MEMKAEFAFEARVTVGEPISLGRTQPGERRIVPITGGSFAGPRLSGSVLPGGADWQVIRTDGVIEVEARYTLREGDGTLIYVVNRGLRHGPPEIMRRLAQGQDVDSAAYYFRTTPSFEVAEGPHAWMRRAIFIGSGIRRPSEVVLRYFEVL
jgi:Protein of unknown function (DUF3237)